MLRFTNFSSEVIFVLRNINPKKIMAGHLVGGLGQGD